MLETLHMFRYVERDCKRKLCQGTIIFKQTKKSGAMRAHRMESCCEIVQKVSERLHNRSVYSRLSNVTYQALGKIGKFLVFGEIVASYMSAHRYSVTA